MATENARYRDDLSGRGERIDAGDRTVQACAVALAIYLSSSMVRPQQLGYRNVRPRPPVEKRRLHCTGIGKIAIASLSGARRMNARITLLQNFTAFYEQWLYMF